MGAKVRSYDCFPFAAALHPDKQSDARTRKLDRLRGIILPQVKPIDLQAYQEAVLGMIQKWAVPTDDAANGATATS
jgi:hypothetical protein